MKKLTAVIAIVTFVITTIFDSGTLAFAMPFGSSATSSGNQSAQLSNISEAAGAVQSFQPDLFTGRAQTSVPIFVPPGRKNVQPNLSLNYSSSGGNSWLGVGWALDMGYIQRDVTGGVPSYDSTDTFVFSFQGVYSELVNVSGSEYRAKDEALFLKFDYDSSNDKWTVTDKSGTQHIFGASSACKQPGPDSDTFRWQLSKVIDTKGNYMTVTHTTDAGHMYLSSIEYNGNETQSFAHSHKVEFTLEDRDDDSFSYISGVKAALNKRLQKIEVKVKDSGGTYQLARRYNLSYTYSTPTGRSLLTGVQECGTDGTTCHPATTFSYQGQANGFETMAEYTNVQRVFTSSDYDYISSTNSSKETLVNVTDLNGDGYLDRVLCDPDTSKTTWKVQFGDDAGFANAVNWGPVEKGEQGNVSRCMQAEEEASSQIKQIADLTDIDGDGRPDRIMADAAEGWKVQLNNGTGFEDSVAWTSIGSTNWGDPSKYIRMRTDDGRTQTELIDMNGDGLPDRVLVTNGENSYEYWKVQFNNGSGFDSAVDFGYIEDTPFSYPGRFVRYHENSGAHVFYTSDLQDLNGDGLPDRIMTTQANTAWDVQWNTGTGFTDSEDFGTVEANSYGLSKYARYRVEFGVMAADITDLNGDGLADRLLADHLLNDWEIQWNNGTGFDSKVSLGAIEEWGTPVAEYSYPRYSTMGAPYNMKVDMMDINGDGAPDRIQSTSGNTIWKIQKNKNAGVDLLSGIDNGRGGETTVTYTVSTRFDNTDSNGKERLPFQVWTVTTVDQEDGMGNTYTTTYNYEGGMYDPTEREFRGFREVTVTDTVGTQTRHTFGQTDHNKGKILTKEVWGHTVDSTGVLDMNSDFKPFSKEETTWSDTHPYGAGVDSHFVYVSQQDNYIYDGDGFSEHIRQSFTYDDYGNLASTTEYGDVSVEGDERKTVNTFIYNTTDYIVNTLKQTTLYDDDTGGSVVAERYFYYDQTTSISTAPTDGLLFREEEWLSTASGCSTPGVCANNPKTTMTYDSYGNMTSVTDARGYSTTNTYDSIYHLFLTDIKNALWTAQNDPDHKRSFTYDPWIAQILTSTDANGQVTEKQYDALGRLTKVISPEDNETNPTQRFTYTDYSSSTSPNKIKTEVKSSASGESVTYLVTYTFRDGLGREIQRRSPAEDSQKQIVTSIVEFNSRGQISKEYTPFEDTTNTSDYRTHTQMSVSSKPAAEFHYDAVGRRTRIDYPDSTFSKVSFNDFVKTATDQRGKQKIFTNDAYGRPVKVEEKNAGNTYTTVYEYDVQDNLVKTTDHLGNITTVSYDSMSRKTQMSDPNMGTWSYAYDKNDNLTSQTDAKSQVISFSYDALNRVTLKDLPSGETDVQYYYDSAPTTYSGQTGYWIGRLSKITDASGTHAFLYDKIGRVLKDTKTVDSTGYEFIRTFDSMGRIRTMKYPDGELMEYTYNEMGDVETILGCESGDPYSSCAAQDKSDYVKDVDYNASGQTTFIKYGNDVTSDYTYDSETLRLSDILTKKPDGTTKLQELSYTFDGNGNVTAIDDTVNSMSQDFTYDDLNRLTQAIGSAYGTENYTYDAIGNMTDKDGMTMSYGAGSAGPHAVTSVSGSSLPRYCEALQTCTMEYDANGNMTKRGVDELQYDSENRLKQIDVYEGSDGTHNFSLAQGWNVVSFTYLPQDKSVLNVLSDMTWGTDYSQVSWWDEAADEWKHFVNDPDFNDFDTFEYGKTYEIYVETVGGETPSVSGKSPGTEQTYLLKAGDNFISPPVESATSVSSVLSSLTLDTDYSDVKRYNTGTASWESWDNGDFTNFEPGVGYNIVGLQDASFDFGGDAASTSTFIYDATGTRVKKTVDSTTTVYFGKDYEKQGSVTTKHIFLGDRRISTKKSDGTFEFIHADHINSSNIITDENGDQTGLLEYSPYGSTVTHTGTADPNHKFTGQEEDSASELYYYGARYYDPELGRFITADWVSQDPSDPQALNRYAYARNNPIIFVDPTGNFFGLIFAAIVAIAKAAAAVYSAVQGVVAGLLASVGFSAKLASLVAHGIVLGAIAGGIDAAINGQNVGKGILTGAIGGAVGAAVLGPGLNSVLQHMGPAIVGHAVRTGIGGFGAYRAIKAKRYAAGALAIVGTLHAAVKLQESMMDPISGPSRTDRLILKSENVSINDDGSLNLSKVASDKGGGVWEFHASVSKDLAPELKSDIVNRGLHEKGLRDMWGFGEGHLTLDKGSDLVHFHYDAHQFDIVRPFSSIAHGFDSLQGSVIGAHIGPGGANSMLTHPAVMGQALNVNLLRRRKE